MGGGYYSSKGAGWALEAAGQAQEAAGWALDTPYRAVRTVPEAGGGDLGGAQRVK